MPLKFEWSTSSEWARSRYSTSAEVLTVDPLPPPTNFLSFLATAQALEVELLPITWTKQVIGVGGTSRLNDSYGNPQTSFAYKRIDDESKASTPRNLIFRALTNEILVLGDEGVHSLPNIVQLQGICWDPSEDGTVWPVLVFEKAQFGDLFRFASGPIGREMEIEQRLSICKDIEAALASMHSMNIVHGDVKPQNVLVFKDETGDYKAKVTDFGYSTRYADEEHRIKLPISWPWNAPEHDRLGREWVPSLAKKLDIFSFGMICFWLLFEPQISGSLPKILNVDLISAEGETPLLTLSRNKKQLRELARQFIAAHDELTGNTAVALQIFFETNFDENPNKRQLCLRMMLRENASQKEAAKDIFTAHGPICSLSSDAFKIEISLFELYRGDYRVRNHVARCLIEEYQAIPQLGFQVAVCYKLGLGVSRDEKRAIEVLEQSSLEIGWLNEALEPLVARLGGPESRTLNTSIRDMNNLGHVEWTGFAFDYLQNANLEEAEMQLRREKSDLEATFGTGSKIVATIVDALTAIYSLQGKWEKIERLCLEGIEACKQISEKISVDMLDYMNHLSRAYHRQGRYQEAEELVTEVVEETTYVWGEDSPKTLESMTQLASVYSDQGRWDDAVELLLNIFEHQMHQLGESHHSTQLTMNNLGLTYWLQGQWAKSLEMWTRVLDMERRVLRDDHPYIYLSMSNIVLSHARCGRWNEADELNSLVLEGRLRVVGPEHPDTLISLTNQAWIYREQGRLEDAARIEVGVIEIGKTVMGPEHPDLLTAMANLAATRWAQDRNDEADQLTSEVLEIRQRVLGPDHPDTLASLSDMASIHWVKHRYEECEALEVETLRVKRHVLGDDHYDTFVSVANLAYTYLEKGQLDKAQTLFEQVLESRRRVLGEEHPDTLSSMFDMASLFRKRNKEGEAMELIEQVLELERRVLGDNHPMTLKSEAFAKRTEV